nr:immunoglobulin heavy chain junction region [Mus musculus]NSM05973.1 immunoglobulin heavy chain junction region [Mus musculus]NSM07586.1 immunoglobulin heavy chain junction region [Mus musculus]NSM08930.1 immunoglobulin heavy chain junction region [Mus musculus]NSM08946.1 immunoglobulin heavy chain junction region [Mus musculus]
CARDSSGYAYW